MKNYYLLLSFICLNCTFLHAQELDEFTTERLVTRHETLAKKQLKENIYLHTDKDIYEPGENLWFKAYILNANTLKISRSTNVVFVELLKEEENEEKIITKEMYTAKNGFASGHLFLAEILKEGNYQLILHTKNTLENTSDMITAIKRFQIKEGIIPKILMDTEFSQKAYERNDQVELNVHVFSRSRVPLKNAVISADSYTTDERLGRVRLRTDSLGKATITFKKDDTEKAEYIELRVRYNDDEVFHIVDIPFKNPAAIQFGMYPEGGRLVENLPNTVAFKAVNHYGKPLHVKGMLYENGNELRAFEATHFGMGYFAFTPKPLKKYTVKLSNPITDSIFQLPLIEKKGIRLLVQKRDTAHIHFGIAKTPDVTLEKVYIRAQSRGLVYWLAMASLTRDFVRFKIPLKDLPQGITEVTVFNDRYEPLTERLVYANIDEKLHVKLTKPSKSRYGQKDKVDLTFTVTDQFGKPAMGHFSLSVFDELYEEKDNHYGMMPHYYLFSELKGHVYNASYYFDEKNNDREKHLDLLLLTQGWRSYRWNTGDLLKNLYTKENPFQEEIFGKVYYRTKSGTLRNGKDAVVQVLLPKLTVSVTANGGGKFSIPLHFLKVASGEKVAIFPVNSAVSSRSNRKKNKDKPEEVFLEITQPFEEIYDRTLNKGLLFPLTDRIIAAKKQSSYNTSFSFTETNFLEEVELTGFKERLKDRGDNVIFEGTRSDYICFEFDILNCVNHTSGPAPEDGKEYKLNNGTTVIYQASKEMLANERKKQNFLMVKGFYPNKEYYNPIYDKEEDKLFPDNRKTLFWKPNLVTDANGEITVSFYTSDIQSTFTGKLEGTNGNGLLGSHTYKFKVN